MWSQGTLLYLISQHSHGKPPDEVTNRYSHFTNPPSASCKEQTTHSSQQAESASLHDIRQKLGAANLPAESIRIIQQSRRPSTTKRYDNYIGKWKVFCHERGIDPISKFLDQPIEFPTKIFESDAGYSSVGTARSALSSVLIMDNGISFGKHPLV